MKSTEKEGISRSRSSFDHLFPSLVLLFNLLLSQRLLLHYVTFELPLNDCLLHFHIHRLLLPQAARHQGLIVSYAVFNLEIDEVVLFLERQFVVQNLEVDLRYCLLSLLYFDFQDLLFGVAF